MSHHADQTRSADDGVARLAVLTQVTTVFGVLTVVGALLAVSQLGGIALPQSTFRGVLGLIAFVIGIYGLARWGGKARRIRRRSQV